MIPIIEKLLHKNTSRRNTFSLILLGHNYFSIKTSKDIIRKEMYRPLFFIKIVAKIINKILTN